MRFLCGLLAALLLCRAQPVYAQADDATPTQDVDRLRTESGVDPTRVQSRAAFSVLLQDLPDDAGQATARGSLVLGVVGIQRAF